MYPLYENHSFLLWAFYLVLSYGSGTPFLWYGTSGKNRVVPDSPIALSMHENGGRTLSPDALASFMFKNQGKIPIYLLDFFDVGKEKLFSLRGIICNDEEKKCCITCHVSRLSCAIH